MASIEEKAVTSKVKSVRAGRSRYTDQYKAEVVAAFEAGSLSASAFARQHGIKAPTFCSWVAKARRRAQSRQAAPSSSAFLIAEIRQESGVGVRGETLEVRLPGGATAMAGTSRQVALLAELLKSLV
jgi:transposase-like protein